MNRFKQLQDLFALALEQPEAEREAWARAQCADDVDLLDELLDLLRLDAQEAGRATVQPSALIAEAFESSETKTLLGRSIGRYQLIEAIGSGGMGRVFKAERIDGEVHQTVALKLMRREMFNEALLKRFSSERQILASLQHPGIAHLIDAGADEDGTPFVVMELIDGLPLMEYCHERKLELKDKLNLFRQILAAVSYAHQNLIVHRDLKPANVLVTREGQIKLLDFGIAKTLHEVGELTATADRFFSPAYAAPEQLLGQPVGVTADVYALGAILYELLSGVPPFDFTGLSAAEIERQILQVPPATLTQAAARNTSNQGTAKTAPTAKTRRWFQRSAFHADLENIVQKALRKEPKRRHPNVEQLDTDILAFLEARPVSASGQSTGYRLRKFIQRNAKVLAVTTLVAIASFAGVFHVIRQNRQLALERDRAQHALDFLAEALNSSNPISSNSGGVSAQQLVLSAVEKLNSLKATQPDLFVELGVAMADVQSSFGLFKQNDDLIKNIYETIENNKGIVTRTELITKLKLLHVEVLVTLERTNQAEAILNTLDQNKLKRDFKFIRTKVLVLTDNEDYDTALQWIDSAQQLTEDSPQAKREKLILLRRSAEILRRKGEFTEALKRLDLVVSELKTQSNDADPYLPNVLLWRLQTLASMGRWDEVETEYPHVKKSLAKIYGEYSKFGGQLEYIMGDLYTDRKDQSAATRQYELAYRHYQFSLGIKDQTTGRVAFNLAQTYAYQLKPEKDPQPYYEAALQSADDPIPVASNDGHYFRVFFLRHLLKTKQHEKAKALVDEFAPYFSQQFLLDIDDQKRLADYLLEIKQSFICSSYSELGEDKIKSEFVGSVAQPDCQSVILLLDKLSNKL